jgi:hypothetical protein
MKEAFQFNRMIATDLKVFWLESVAHQDAVSEANDYEGMRTCCVGKYIHFPTASHAFLFVIALK